MGGLIRCRNGPGALAVEGASPYVGVYRKLAMASQCRLMVFGRSTAIVPPERRANPRTEVHCAARLRTSFGEREGTLSDLSISGARFHTANPPKEGSTALLEWETHDAMCRIVWARNDVCGVLFDRPIPRHVVDKCAPTIASAEPPAEVHKIPLGQRSALRAVLVRNAGSE